MAPWCPFNSTIKEVGSTNIALGYLPSKAIGKKLYKEVLFDCFDKFLIWDFGNTWH